jgi:hypothetical protein
LEIQNSAGIAVTAPPKPIEILRDIFASATKWQLAEHIGQLEAMDGSTVLYPERGLQAPIRVALALARKIHQALRRTDAIVAEELFAAAEQDMRDVEGQRNLADWVGLRTPAAHAVLGFSDPDTDRRDPWFMDLVEDDQRTLLLLVGHIILSE